MSLTDFILVGAFIALFLLASARYGKNAWREQARSMSFDEQMDEWGEVRDPDTGRLIATPWTRFDPETGQIISDTWDKSRLAHEAYEAKWWHKGWVESSLDYFVVIGLMLGGLPLALLGLWTWLT